MIDALTQAKSALEGVRGALGIFSKTEVDMTLGMLDRAIAKYTSLDAICQDLQEKTYTQAMRIAELEAKLAEAEKQEPVTDMYRNKCADGSRCLHGCHTSERCYHDTHPQPKREWVGLTDEEIKRIGKLDWDDNYVGLWYDFAKALEAKLKAKNFA
jgi:hypothetical protein